MTKQEQSDWMFQLAITQGRTKRPSLATQAMAMLARLNRHGGNVGDSCDEVVKTQNEISRIMKGEDGEELPEAVV